MWHVVDSHKSVLMITEHIEDHILSFDKQDLCVYVSIYLYLFIPLHSDHQHGGGFSSLESSSMADSPTDTVQMSIYSIQFQYYILRDSVRSNRMRAQFQKTVSFSRF